MRNKITAFLLIALFALPISAHVKEKEANINDMVEKMKIELNLTESQVKAVKPILKESLMKRQNYMQSLESELTINKTRVKNTLRKLRQEENQKLSQVLTPQQMNKRIEKQNLRDSLNRDQIFFSEGQEDVVMTPQGGAMQF